MSSETKVMNRWIVVIGAILVQLCLGAIYAWSVFTGPLQKSHAEEFLLADPSLGVEKEYYETARREGTDRRDLFVIRDRERFDAARAQYTQLKSAIADAKANGDDAAGKIAEEDLKVFLGKLDGVWLRSVLDSESISEAGIYAFTATETQFIFSVGLFTFAVVMALVAGNWQKKVGPRVVAMTGGIVLGIGYALAGLAGTSFWGILVGVGVLGGAGIGLGYVCPIAVLVKWFPDKKGLITGLAVAGFGFGALIWIKLTSGFVFGPVDLTPGWTGLFGMGWTVNQVFMLYGGLFAALVVLGSLVLINPPGGWLPAGWTPPKGAAAAASGGDDYTTGEMVKTPQFWGLFLIFMVGATAGLMVIGVIALFGNDALTANGIAPDQAKIMTGTAMGLFFALMNGLGRIVWGTISDKLGRRNSIALMSLLQGGMMLAFFFIGGNEIGLYFGAAVIGFNFGGNFALFPAATADFFGNKNVGTNYPWVFMSYGVGGIVGPILGGMMGDAKAWMWAFIPAGIACIVAGLVGTMLRPPKRA